MSEHDDLKAEVLNIRRTLGGGITYDLLVEAIPLAPVLADPEAAL